MRKRLQKNSNKNLLRNIDTAGIMESPLTKGNLILHEFIPSREQILVSDLKIIINFILVSLK